MWCLWELFSAIEHDCEIFVHTSGKLHAAFQKQIMDKKEFKSLIALFSTAVVSEDAVASDLSHGAMLRACLRRAGFQYLDYQVSFMLRKWLARSGQALVERLLSTMGPDDQKDKKTALGISVLVGGLWKDLGDLDAAEPMYRCVLHLREEVLGKDSARTIKALQNLGSLLQALHSQRVNNDANGTRADDSGPSAQDYLSEAELLFRRALVKQEQMLGLTNPLTLQSINNFAVFCQKHKKLREAELLYRRAYQGFENAHGKRHEHTLQAGHNLASLLQEEGETTEAAALYQEVYEGRVAVLGGEDPRTLQTQSKLGTLYQATGDVTEAENIFRQLITMYTDSVGARSAEVIDAKAMLAACLIDSKRHEESEVLLAEVFAQRRELFGEADLSTLSAASELASLHFSQKKYDEAETMYRRILELRYESSGKRHMSTLAVMTKIASVCYSKNDLDQAEVMYRQALSGYRRTVGMSSPLSMGCVDMLARLLKQQGKFEDALLFYKMAHTSYCETLGPDSPDALNMAGCCGMCLRAMGDEREGNAMLRDAVSKLKAALKKEPVNSPILKSLKRRITRFEQSLTAEQTNLKASLKRTLSASFDQLTGGLRRKSSKKVGKRKGAWTKSSSSSSSSSHSRLETKNDEPTAEDRHFKPAGIAVAATHRLMAFARPRAVQPAPFPMATAAAATASSKHKAKGDGDGDVGTTQKRPRPLVVRGARGPRMRPRGVQPRPPKGSPPPVKITPRSAVRVAASPRRMLQPRPVRPGSLV
jgi:tetratricopeptide (TPR) repeat protein